MSSIRLFILSSFADLGPMHGHRLRLHAQRNHVALWTDITVGAVYGAMRRLAAEGLLAEVGREKDGNRPTRRLYEITDAGHRALERVRDEALRDIWFRYDPFDLALTRASGDQLADLPAILRERLDRLRAMLAEARRVNEGARPHVGVAKQWALRHTEYRLEAEIAYLGDLVEAAAEIATDPLSSR